MVTFAKINTCACYIKKNRSHLMKNSSSSRFLRYLLIIAGVPFILVCTLMILLYIPTVQQHAVDTLCKEISASSGYDISIGSVHLQFPLKLQLNDISMSRGDTLYVQGERIGVNVSPMPLLKGEAEVNYIELEGIWLDTKGLIPDVAITGEVDYMKGTARNIDLTAERVNIRQIHLYGAQIAITLTDTVPDDNEESAPFPWVFDLHKATIEKSRVSLHIPADTLSLTAGIGKASIQQGQADISRTSYTVGKLSLHDCSAKYDKGTLKKEDAPLQHITLEDINLNAGNMGITPGHARVDIEMLTFTQPQGISLAAATAAIECDSTSLNVKELLLHSHNGSLLEISGNLPWQALSAQSKQELAAHMRASLNKRDLCALLTREQYSALSFFDDDMFNARTTLHGNVSRMYIDTLDITLPTLAALSVTGCLKELEKAEGMTAMLEIGGEAYDIRKFIASLDTATLPDDNNGRATFSGTLAYKAGTADADLLLHAAGGNIKAVARYDIAGEEYNAHMTADSLNITKIIPSLPIERVSLQLLADGHGLDIFNDSTTYNMTLSVDTVRYGNISTGGITVNASQANSLSQITAQGNSPNLKFLLNAYTGLHRNDIMNSTTLHVDRADFTRMHVTEANFATAMKMSLDLRTDLGEKHALRLNGKEIKIFTDIKTFTPKDIAVDLYTAPDSSSVSAVNGDLKIAGSMDCGYNGLLQSLDKVGDMFIDALKHDNMVHYMQDYQELLPKLHFKFTCGRDNMLANFMAMQGVTASSMRVNIDMDTISGLNLRGGVYGFKSGSLNLDTVRMFTRQEGDMIRYFAGVRSTALNPLDEKQTYSASLYGNLTNDLLTTNFLLRDKEQNTGARLGATTRLKPNGLDISFAPKAVLLGEDFTFNDGNYINIGKGLSVEADVTMNDRHGSGIRFYTIPGTGYTHNANLELFNVNLKKLTGAIPYAPDLAGMLNLDLNIKNGEQGFMLGADAFAEALAYEGVPIGNEIIEAVYFPKDNDTHYIDLRLLHEEEETVHLSGNYETGGLDGKLTLTRFPLAMSRAFLQDAGVNLDGYINGNMNAKGKLSRLNTDGYIQFESASIDAYRFGANLHIPDETVDIKDNKLLFNDFDIYTQGDNPFKINGSVDFSTLLNPAFDLRMNANGYELINSPRKKGSMLYGRLFVDIRAMIGGTLDKLRMYGNVAMKSKSNITYVMLDAPIESDKELDGLVDFVNFKDTTAVATREKEIDLGDIDLNLNLTIDDGARINADLDAARHNYVTTEGSGNMYLAYTGESGINVTGHYTMRDGEFKLSLPVIPLKTLNISDGSAVRWTGALLDPTLDITALERTTSSVTFDDNSTQPVPFDVGVKVTGTLERMGLSFIMQSPENPIVQEQLNALDTESMNRYAVTMLLTGTYAGSSRNMTVSNALSSFIDAKINDIAGTAMKSVSVNVGISDATNAETGSNYKNYSFSFSKRFWNDRVTLVVGGEVNSGDAPNGNNSFINNASLEWKLSENSNRYLKLFYDKNYESILEGEITETGIGYVYKRKLNRLKELFIFRNAKKEPTADRQ